MGQQISWSGHNGLGLPSRKIDINGVMTDYTYDAFGNVLSQTVHLSTGDNLTTFVYDGSGHVTDILHSDGHVERFRYNTAGRLISRGNALSEFVNFSLNTTTNTTTTSSTRMVPTWSGSTLVGSVSGMFSSTLQSDFRNRPWIQTGNHGQKVTYGYDKNDNLTSTTDVINRLTSVHYDARNRPTLQVMQDGGNTAYGYSQDGWLATVTDPDLIQTKYGFNGFGEMIFVDSPDAGTTTISRDAFGRSTNEVRSNGTSILFTYDAVDRLTSRASGNVTETFTYDEGANGNGHLTTVIDKTGKTTFQYDALGHLVRQVNTVFGSNYVTTWSYDSAGRLLTMTYPNGFSVGYGYDSYGRVSLITSSQMDAFATLATNFLYQPATNRLYSYKFGN
jgi:YD repeat-containing protein